MQTLYAKTATDRRGLTKLLQLAGPDQRQEGGQLLADHIELWARWTPLFVDETADVPETMLDCLDWLAERKQISELEGELLKRIWGYATRVAEQGERDRQRLLDVIAVVRVVPAKTAWPDYAAGKSNSIGMT